MKQIRFGKYCKYQNIDFEFYEKEDELCRLIERNSYNETIRKMGFHKYAGSIYILDVNCSEIQSAYYVNTLCSYKSGTYYIDNIHKGQVVLFPDKATKAKLGLYWKDDREYMIDYDVFMRDVEEIWEERRPIEGFVFDVEPIYYIKKKS